MSTPNEPSCILRAPTRTTFVGQLCRIGESRGVIADNSATYNPFTSYEFGQLIDHFFEVPDHPGMYILGSFAKHVTLYSQQVRAFNLAYGLSMLGKIKAGTKVAVVGAGAAGVTVAAAMADLGCAVTLFDEHAGVLELQRNSRQRWIHPFLYDWPKVERAEDKARLPILDWSAGYADQVAAQIERDWDAFVKELPRTNRGSIRTVFSVRGLKYSQLDVGHHYLRWDSPKEGLLAGTFERMILAVGFGLEPIEPGRNSYWEDDGIDAGFRGETREEPWIVSGGGDAGLIDLMRICIKDFRHADIIDFFRSLPGIANLADELSDLEMGNIPDENLSKEISDRIGALVLKDKLEPKLRKAERDVTFSTKNSHPYGRGSSLLNRIIVAAIEHSSGFKHEPRKTRPIEFAPTKSGQLTPRYWVSYEKSLEEPTEFHRAVVRHGPESSIDRFWANQRLPNHCLDVLRERWKTLYSEKQTDESKVRHWIPDTFSRAASEKLSRKFSTSVEAAARKQGFRIESLTWSKQIREDGSSSVAVLVDGLEAVGRTLNALPYYIASKSGNVGIPTLEQSAARSGFHWVSDQLSESKPTSLEEKLVSVHSQTGSVQFDKPLNDGDMSRTFSLSTVILNGDALSAWEFEQLYPGVSGEGSEPNVRKAYECFARIVSVPVETFKIRVTLPEVGLGQPAVKKLLVPRKGSVQLREGALYSVPKNDAIGWKEAVMPERWELCSLSAQTWELTVHSPEHGGCYALEWSLPDLAPPETPVEPHGDETLVARNEFYRSLRVREDDTKVRRGQLVQYGAARRGKSEESLNAAQKGIRELLLHTHARMKEIINEPFELSLMTYKDEAHCLVFVDGVDGASTSPGSPPRPEMWDHSFPFGIGLSGTCFRQAEFVFFHFAGDHEKVEGEPAAYLPIPGEDGHRGMVVFPVWHPKIMRPPQDNSNPKLRIDTTKQLLGVLDIGFMKDSAWLRRASVDGRIFEDLDLIRKEFSITLVERLEG